MKINNKEHWCDNPFELMRYKEESEKEFETLNLDYYKYSKEVSKIFVNSKSYKDFKNKLNNLLNKLLPAD